MNTFVTTQVEISPPPFSVFENGGRLGGGYETPSHNTKNLRARKRVAPRHDTYRNQTPRTLTRAPNGWSPFQTTARYWQLHFDKLSASIVDFCAPRRKLIIELDGSQHLEQQEYDEERSVFLKSKGYRILRFWNNDVMNNTDSVLTEIWDMLKARNSKGMK